MYIMNERQFQCATTTCLPYSTVKVSNIRQCQFNCLAQVQCIAASFRRSNSTCQLFDNTPTSSPTLDEDIDNVAMMIISPGEYWIVILLYT